ncbi:MAG: hypothetical protein HWN79_08125 [Candidatus Lokiarchaeota archaeon]|nr:hypothetical protein [Candidatus Lokiarchaeota archaeon]
MHSTQKIIKKKRITFISLLFASIPVALIYLFLREIPVLNSLFVNYIYSGTSIFFPFLPYTNIVFNFSTSHLLDIIIILNIIGSLERTGYHYYTNVILKKNYLEVYPELYFLETNEMQEESTLNANLILSYKKNLDTLVNESSGESTFYRKSIIKANRFSNNRGYCGSRFKIECINLNTNFQNFSTNILINYHLPSKNNNLFSNSFENFHQEEGIY